MRLNMGAQEEIIVRPARPCALGGWEFWEWGGDPRCGVGCWRRLIDDVSLMSVVDDVCRCWAGH